MLDANVLHVGVRRLVEVIRFRVHPPPLLGRTAREAPAADDHEPLTALIIELRCTANNSCPVCSATATGRSLRTCSAARRAPSDSGTPTDTVRSLPSRTGTFGSGLADRKPRRPTRVEIRSWFDSEGSPTNP